MPRFFLVLSAMAAMAALPALNGGCYRHTRRDSPSQPPEAIKSDTVTIPPGTFTRGDINGEPDEYPEQKVSMESFKLERTEVTNKAYRACVEARACDPSPYLDDPDLGSDDRPVVGVSWEDAGRYCTWIGRRLPTEAEWEYAARGIDLRKWPWTGAFDPKRANTNGNDGYAMTSPPGMFVDGASPFGVLDMAGNVAEWVGDYYDPTLYQTSGESARDPKGPERGRERVVRGGSYRDSQHDVRVAARRPKLPTDIDDTVGIRCAEDSF